MTKPNPSAAALLIGDELLSGRTQDVNLQTLARFLSPFGVVVREARIVADEPEEIVAALNALRGRYDYVFTTGGIGPTHDDKTADAVAAAFGVPIDVRDDARALLEGHYGAGNLNDARLRMARIPEGASLIANPVSKAPGFQLENVFVLAGVPSIMRGMLEDVGSRLATGPALRQVSVRASGLRESELAAELAALAEQMPDLSFGSYPFGLGTGEIGVTLVVRGTDEARLAAAEAALVALVRAKGAEPGVERA